MLREARERRSLVDEATVTKGVRREHLLGERPEALPEEPSARGSEADLVTALACIKQAAALTNNELGLLTDGKTRAIVKACEEIREGGLLDHFVVDVIHGQARHEPLPTREPFGMNPATGRQRYGTTVRTTPAPCSVMRVGHVALCVRDFAKTHDFYSQVLGFKASDTYWAGQEDNVIAAFMHCGLGDRWTDHHTLALITAQDGQARFDHSAFEVLDLDDLVQGGEYLRAKGWQHSWLHEPRLALRPVMAWLMKHWPL